MGCRERQAADHHSEYPAMMPDRSSKRRTVAKSSDSPLVGEDLGSPPPSEGVADKNPAAVALGRLGGLKGGKARAAKLTPEQRSEIAKKAATERWSRCP